MLSRRTTRLLADLYANRFSYAKTRTEGTKLLMEQLVRKTTLYDFLYEHDFDKWACNTMRKLAKRQDLRDFVMKLHTTESFKTLKPWTKEGKARRCQEILLKLSESVLADSSDAEGEALSLLRAALELDGYVFRDGKLLASESETQDVEEERGELMTLYVKLQLPNETLVKDCLDKSETHYDDGNYRDCIANARHYLEQVLNDVAVTWSTRPGAKLLNLPDKGSTAGLVRKYLSRM